MRPFGRKKLPFLYSITDDVFFSLFAKSFAMFSQVSSVCREHNLGSLFMVSGYSSVCSSTCHKCFLSCPVAFLLARELFKCAALKFNFSSVE